VGSALFHSGLIDSDNCRWIARFRLVPARLSRSGPHADARDRGPPLASPFVPFPRGPFFPDGDFYRVNEVPAPFYNRRERSPDDDSNNCRAYGRSIGHSACRRGRPRDIPRGPALTAARPGPGTLFPDEYGNPWVTMIIIVRPYLHPNGVAERRSRGARRASYVRRFFAASRKGRASIPVRFVGDNNDFAFTAGVAP